LLIKVKKTKKMKKLFLVLLMIPLFVLVNCKKDNDDPPTPPPSDSYEILADYLVANDMDLPDILDGWITAAPLMVDDVPMFLEQYDVIDIRGVDDFNGGHIQGAVNSTLANILTTAASTTKPILVVCYTGQSAAHGTVALRLSGYEAKVLKWGMSGWNSNLSGPWLANSGPENGITAIDNPNWVTTATEGLADFNNPTLTGTDGATILEAQVEKMITEGFKGIANVDVLDNTGAYFINNYWDQVDVDHYGHIATAYRIKPLSIENGEMKNIDPSKTAVIYCWTGQTSSMVTAYLNVIGYNAKSLKFGANGMIYTVLESHQFVTPSVDLPIEE
jgi:rhodanese-related sulfurtransferase